MPILVSSLVVWAGLLTISRALLLTTGIDPWAFTFIQMLSGGVTLLIFAWRPGMSWRGGCAARGPGARSFSAKLSW